MFLQGQRNNSVQRARDIRLTNKNTAGTLMEVEFLKQEEYRTRC